MKYVALLSGGKDSCYNLMHCARNGHELIAAASLGPGQGKEELDSYMYQTVGQDAIHFVAQALDVPLYRKVILGSALQQGSEYGGRNANEAGGVAGDETEDLYDLLSAVKSHHPDIQGVSVGAILSNYQRVRVEHVCLRLALTPLCYLWQRNQRELLSEMIQAGVSAIIIKVAGIGLTTKHLGKTLAEMQTTLERLNDLYDSHICGEGGEYETLTLDCPLFKRRIALGKIDTIIHSDHDFATVAYLRVSEAHLLEKPFPHDLQITMPPLLSKGMENLRIAIDESKPSLSNVKSGAKDDPISIECTSRVTTNRLGPWVAVTNVQRDTLSPLTLSVEEEVAECFQILQENLAQYSLMFSNLAHINIMLSNVDYFPKVNDVYKTYFGTSPPSRACVAVDLPSEIRVRVDCVAFSERSLSDRQALHVQGLSYWAPANIGPYSQAVTVDERIFISGQIGLVPSNLALPSPQSLALEAALSFQHVDRIFKALRSGSNGDDDPIAQCTLCWLTAESDLSRIRGVWAMDNPISLAPTLFVGVKSLPKGALIETQVIMHTGRTHVVDEDYCESVVTEMPHIGRGELMLGSSLARWEVSTCIQNGSFSAIISIKHCAQEEFATRIKATEVLLGIWQHTLSVRIFHKSSELRQATTFTEELFSSGVKPAIAHVPVRFIATREAGDWDFAICMLGGMPPRL